MTAAKTTKSAKPNLWQRINAVRAELKKVDRDKEIGSGSYSYSVTTHEAIKAILRPLMAAHGLVDYVDEAEMVRVDTGVLRGKQKLFSCQGKYIYTVVNMDDPEDKHSFFVRGDGEDSGDKGPGKSSTYALKTGQKVLFQIGTKGDEEEDRIPDEEISQAPPPVVSDAEIDQLMELADELFSGPNEANEMLKLLANSVGAKDITELPVARFKQAMKSLRSKAASLKKEPEVSKVDSKDELELKPWPDQPEQPPTPEPEESL